MSTFFVMVALFSQGTPLATNIRLVGPLSALECMAEYQVIEGAPDYIVPGAHRSVRCMDGTTVARVMGAEKSCTLIDGRPDDYERDYACTGELAK